MKSLFLIAPTTLTVLALANLPEPTQTPAVPTSVVPAQAAFSPTNFGPEFRTDVDRDEVHREYINRRMYVDPRVKPGAVVLPSPDENPYEQALQQWSQLPRVVPTTPGSNSLIAQGTVWRPIGPSPETQGTGAVNGTVSAIAINPFNPNVIYMGSLAGGVWRTINGGTDWTPLFDQQPSLGLGQPTSIAIDPLNTNLIFVGTSATFNFSNSRGILRSVDGGASWISLGSGFPAGNNGNANQFFGRNITSIIVDPTSAANLYLADNSGLYRSTDGGLNWTQGAGVTGLTETLVLDPTSPRSGRRLYAGVNSQGIFQSVDGGQNWTRILDVNSAVVLNAYPAPPAGGTGPFPQKVVVALAPPTSPPNGAGIQVLYASINAVAFDNTGAQAYDQPAIFRSIDQGVNWDNRTATGIGGCQCFYTQELGIDPASPGDGANDILLWGGTTLHRSTNSGSTFADVTNGQHVDTHATPQFFRRPSLPSIILVGNDGGIWRSTDDGAHWTGTGLPGAPATINAGGLQTCLFYNLDIKHNAAGDVTMGGLQDNGQVRTTGNPPGIVWNDTKGGDGWDIAFDGVTTTRAYHTGGFYGGAFCTRVFRSTDSGATWPTDVTPPLFNAGCFIGLVNTDPTGDGVVYASDPTTVWQSIDAGATWDALFVGTGPLAQVDVAPANGNNVVIATGGQVFVTQDAFAATPTFTDITRNLPGATVTRAVFDPNDPTAIYAVLSGFFNGHVFRTTIGAAAWTNISVPGLFLPHNTIAMDGSAIPSTIFVGTDLGVLRSVDNGANWAVLDDLHLPNVPVTDLVMHGPSGALRAGTYGRGAFQLTFPTGPVIAANAVNGLNFGNVCVNTSSTTLLQVFNVGTTDLVINSVQRLVGSPAFSVLPNPQTPLVIHQGSEVDFTVRYTPSNPPVSESAIIRISSNDPAAPFFDLLATGSGATGHIVTKIVDTGAFGNVCLGDFKDLELTLQNSGLCDLTIFDVTSNNTRFQVANVTTFPIVLAHGGSTQIPIRFTPTAFGPSAAVLTIFNDDPSHNPPGFVTVGVDGTTAPPDISVSGSTAFGEVCAGDLAEKEINICNLGLCNLHITNVAFVPACADFTIVNNPFPPAGNTPIFPSDCVPLTIRYTPTGAGTHACNLRITSDDPDEATINLAVTGTTPATHLDVHQPDIFPATVVQSVATCESIQPLLITNTGKCPVTVTDVNITQDPDDPTAFELRQMPSFPVTLLPGQSLGGNGAKIVFHPHVVEYNIAGTLNVVFVDNDPLLGDLGLITRPLCGDGVLTGARVLVTRNGVPLDYVNRITLYQVNDFGPPLLLSVIDDENGLPLLTNTVSCLAPFQYHREWGTEFNPILLQPGDYLIEARKGSDIAKLFFHVEVCDFLPDLVLDFP